MLKESRIANLGTFFPEITVGGRIGLEDVKNIILTSKDKNVFLSALRENSEFRKLTGTRFKSNMDVETTLRERFGINVLVPKGTESVDEAYWRIIGLPIPACT